MSFPLFDPMIIDFHTHVFPDKIAQKTIQSLGENCGIPHYSDGTARTLNEKLAAAEVDIAVNLPAITKPQQFESVLSFSTELNRVFGNSDSRILSFAGIHPDCEDIDEKMSEIRSLGFKGIKLHPDYQNHFIDDEGYVKILKAAKREGLIVVTHAGLDGAFVGKPIKCTPDRVLNLLDAVGGYDKFVLAHLGGNELFDEVYEKLCGLDVYFDTSYVLHVASEETFKKILLKHGEDKILFATDSPWRDVKEEVTLLKSYSLGKETEEKLFSLNAKKLLGI